MKTVLLIGDSTMFGSTVSGGYGIYLANRYTVFEMGEVLLPNENCQDTRFTLNTFDEIFAEHKDRLSQVDLVHWNNGLWDTLHFLGNPRATVPIERYLKNLSEIHKLLLEKCPHAKIAFATSTPVDEGQNGKTYRTNAEIRDYNLGACRLLSGLGCYINDLYTFADENLWKHRAPDGVHFTDAGCILLSGRVMEFIEEVLENG